MDDLGGWGGTPRVGNHVVIGAGAKLLGHRETGADCDVGANTVVRTSVRYIPIKGAHLYAVS